MKKIIIILTTLLIIVFASCTEESNFSLDGDASVYSLDVSEELSYEISADEETSVSQAETSTSYDEGERSEDKSNFESEESSSESSVVTELSVPEESFEHSEEFSSVAEAPSEGTSDPVEDGSSEGTSDPVEDGSSEDASDVVVNPEPPASIEISSLSELSYMREMLSCTDEEILSSYLEGLSGGGASCKEDLEKFVELVDSIPYVSFIDGEIVWIFNCTQYSQTTGRNEEVLFITVQKDSGEWVRLEYILSLSASEQIGAELDKIKDTSNISSPVFSDNKKIAFYAETRENHPSGTGEIINWIADIDGIFTRVVYYTHSPQSVTAVGLLKNAEISTVQDR